MAAIAEEVERKRRKRQAESLKKTLAGDQEQESYTQLIESNSKNEREAAAKAAAIFPTNRQYIHDAKRLKETRPEAFKAVQSGEKTIPQVKKEIREEERAQDDKTKEEL